MKYIITCNKMKSAKTLMKQFIEKLYENNEISSVAEATNTVYLLNGDSFKFCTTKMKNTYNGRYISQKVISEGKFREAVWNYNPIRDHRFYI